MDINLPISGLNIRPGKVLCIGRNYAAHAAEMQSAIPVAPVIFLKPPTALIGNGGEVLLPSASREVHHEVELVVLIGKKGKNIPVSDAMKHVEGYALGIDMTARDLQAEAKRNGLPWSVAKGFDTFAPLGAFTSARDISDPRRLGISLHVNGVMRQQGSVSRMVFGVDELVAYASSIFTLMPGDLMYTGTPEGVAAVEDGDRLVARGTGLQDLTVDVRRL
ncbi:MAG: fumarylacetoacetate hydrolase family protein [Bacteroidetes bacterium SB0662_bin_6]|nr:fumarylacetoacetate hydrolase family protein [Bacteroidetes bacterium SB0668_bin_1]MYE03571.1 fumarylacetoacetate hydrolase family protein [Bacteroidetes bacterium SB0662_bin_6]